MPQIDFETIFLSKKVSSMRRTTISSLFCSVALAASLAISFSPQIGFAKSAEAEKPAKEVKFNPKSVGTFAGAFLAARTADIGRDYATAIPLYRKALDFDPANSDLRQRLMIAYLLNGDFDEGVKLAEGLKNDPVVERVTTIVRSLSAIKAKKYKQARELLIYKGDNDLDKMVNTFLTAWADYGAGEKTKALDSVINMKGPAWIGVFQRYNAGNLALLSGKTEIARQQFSAAVTDREGGATASDTYMRAVFALATLEANAGNKQKAFDVIAMGDEFAPNYAPLKALRQQIARGKKLPQQVNNAAEGAASVMFSIAAALNRDGAEEIVTLYLQASRALDPKSADTLIMLGGLAEGMEKPQLAIDYYRQVPSQSPQHRISQLQLGLTLAQTDKTKESRKHLKALLDADPEDIRSYLAYGSVLSEAKEYGEMAKVYDAAVKVIGEVPKRSDWTIFFQRGIAYERLKEWNKAEPNFKQALKLNPDQPQVLNYLGYSWVDRNENLEEAMKMIERAVELRPNDGYIVDSLGWAHYRLGEFDKAVTELERAVELRAGDPTITDHLGDAYWRVGRKIEAVYQWNRALNGESDDIDKAQVQQKIENGLPELDKNGKPPMAAEGKQDEKKL